MTHKVLSVACLLGMTLSLACSPDPIDPPQAVEARIPQGRPIVPAGAWKSVLDGPHPRLLGPSAYIKQLAADKPDLYREIKAENDTQAACIVQAVEALPADVQERYVARANNTVKRGVTNIHQSTWSAMQRTAMIFDAFHDAISPEDRRKIIDWLNAHLEFYVDDEGAFHNSTQAKVYCYLQVAYATWGENPRATEFRDYAIKKLYEGRILPTLRQFGAGGGMTEGGWYARHSLWPLVQALELARRVEGYDGFAEAPEFFYQRLAYEIHQPYPGMGESGCQSYAMEGDGKVIYSQAMELPRVTRMVLAQYFRGTELARYDAAFRRPTQYQMFRTWDFLYEEAPDAPRDVSDMPLAHLASGIGKVYARSDWGDDATWLRFECGDFFTQHNHFEAGNFEIFRRKPLATESGVMSSWNSPQAVNWYIRSIAHNCILVNEPDQQWPFLLRDPGHKTPLANDGGQANNTRVPATVEEYNLRRNEFHRGSITAYENRPEFMYVCGDYAAAYDWTKVSRCTRQIVFVRPGTIVILDRVTSTRPDYAKTWLLHSHNEPQIDGTSTRIADGAGKLLVQTLLPERAKVAKVKGYTYGGESFGSRSAPATSVPATSSKPASTQAASAPRRRGDEEDADIENLWRIEVTPAEATADTVFLHVLSTDDNPSPAELVRQGDLLGARGKGWQVLFDQRGGGKVTVAGKSFVLQEKVQKGKYE